MKKAKKLAAIMLAVGVTCSSLTQYCVYATEANEETGEVGYIGDEVNISDTDRPYLALGENLTDEQRNTVLDLMGIDAEDLDAYDVVYVNNKEEHEYLDAYIESSAIGTKSLSSVVITQAEKGAGLSIQAHNINYCTIGMYKNACATAGVEDANIIIAGPFSISGTAALVGIFKAYEEMTGDEINDEIIDAAMDELVTTGELNDRIDADPEKVEALIANLKNQLNDLKTADEIKAAILDTAQEYDIKLSDEDVKQLTELLQKLKGLDVDWDSIADQAADWAQNIKDLNIDTDGFWDKIVAFFESLLEALKDLF